MERAPPGAVVSVWDRMDLAARERWLAFRETLAEGNRLLAEVNARRADDWRAAEAGYPMIADRQNRRRDAAREAEIDAALERSLARLASGVGGGR